MLGLRNLVIICRFVFGLLTLCSGSFAEEPIRPRVWIYTDMSNPTLPGTNHRGTVNDPDDVSAMAGYLLMANRFETLGIVVASTHRKEHAKSPDQAAWASQVFGQAYFADLPHLQKSLGGYPEEIQFVQSCIKESAEKFDEKKQYASLNEYSTVKSLFDTASRLGDDEVINVLCWGSLTEPAILVSHCLTTSNQGVLKKLRFIAHWTNSPLHQGSPEHPEDVANCRENAAACRYMKAMAGSGKIVYHECGAIGQHGIVSGSPKGKEYFDQFRTSQLGTLFVEGKFVHDSVDHSDSATYWVLLGDYGVSLKDIAADGTNSAAIENVNEATFAASSQKIHDELLRRSKIAAVPIASRDKKPNLLFIAMDDLNDWVGCMKGHPQTITPNLDRLAASGVLFTNAHCPAPACNPSRSAIFTGRAPNRSGLYDNRQSMREIMPTETIIPQYFRNHGYHAAGSGKLLHYFIDAKSWDDYFPQAESENPFPDTYYPKQRPVSLERGGPWQYVETDWAALDVTDEEFGGDWSVSKWIGEQLSKQHDKPFFLGCGLYRPHEPWFVPKKYFEPFPLESIQLPPGYKENDLDDVPEAGQTAARNKYFAHIQQQGQWKQAIQGYLASIHFADAMLGRVLDALESGPNANNTIVVLWSDHGWQLGEKEHWQKFTPWRAVTRVPLIVRVPQNASAALPNGTGSGRVCDAPVNLLSLFPTLLELCKLPANPNNDGASLLPLLQEPARADWDHESVTYLAQPGAYAISGRSRRYIHYADGSEELYDIAEDPYEWTNLANAPESQELLASFRDAAPKDFAQRVEPSVDTLAKLTWHPATEGVAPPSKPDGNPFPVHFINKQRQAVELFWMSPEGQTKSYGMIDSGKTISQQTRPGAVWAVGKPNTDQKLGHFIIGDRTAQAVIPATKPNVIVILTDDQGWSDLGCQGVQKDVKTPHIDALASRGVRCSAGYVTAPQCSPSRAGLITGRHQQRWGIDTIPDMPLPNEAVTIAERLQPLGYRTGFVGKWHLEPNVTCADWLQRELPDMASKPRNQVRIPWNKIQPYSPKAQGFDEYFWGELRNYRVNYEIEPKENAGAANASSIQILPQMKQIQNNEFRIDVQTEAAVSFIERNHAAPFYLQLNYYGPHTPLEASKEYLDRFPEEMPTRRRYALAMIAAIDDGVGRVVAELTKHGLLDNTLIVMTSDNGAPLKMTKLDSPIDGDAGGWDGSLNEPWVGEKGMLSEGGIRVPMIWSLPSQLPSGKTYNWPVSTLDIAPSVLQLAGGNLSEVKDQFDGIDLIPAMNDIQNPSTRTLYFRFWDQAAIRQGKWKYIFVGDGQRFLFDLESDQHEHKNLHDQHPDLAAKLHEDLKTWSADLKPSGLPTGNKMRERNWYDFYFAK